MSEKTFQKTPVIISLVMELVAIVTSVYGICVTVHGLSTFTYFTTLSNIAVDLILAVFAYANIVLLKSGGKKDIRTNTLYIIKYIFTVSITITFLVYMFILAPTTPGGILYAYFAFHAGSLCEHFINPLLAILDFLLFDYRYESTKKHAVYAILPALFYLGYVVIMGYSGYRWGQMSAPYNFLNFGAPTGWFGWDLSLMGPTSLGIGVFYLVIVLILFFLALGAVYLKIKDMRRKAMLK